MRICHACKCDLDTTSLVTGKCPHCGAVLRKLAQRTIDDARLQDDSGKSKDIELIVDESADDLKDTDQGGATIELQSFFDLDEYRKNKAPSGEQSLETPSETPPTSGTPTPPDLPKMPTIADRSDMTMDIQAFSAVQQGEEAPA